MAVQKITSDFDYHDESVPAHPEREGDYPVVVFGDHGFCAGTSIRVFRMPKPHMHSQVEVNLITKGAMTYWIDGRQLTLGEGTLALFWGMIPHQVIDREEGTSFVVIYVPMSVFLELPALSGLRQAIFRGAVIVADEVKSYEAEIFLRWRDDLLSGDTACEPLVRDELTARFRRIEREGWRDLRNTSPVMPRASGHDHDHDRVMQVEKMARYIGEKALENLTTETVARQAGLHPNYAMALFKRAMGLTIKQSITRHRLDTARSMLIATDLPVATVAFDCGFGSLSSFYEAFATRFQSSPAQFRKSVMDNARGMRK